MNNQIEMLKQIDNIHAGKSAVCPKCGSSDTESTFFMFSNRMGCGDITCKSCGESVHISRIKIPETSKAKIEHIK